MTNSQQPHREHPSTYMVQDRSNEEEQTRLRLQDTMLTAAMGGVLPEQPDPTRFQRVIDVGCGTGGWLIEGAKTYATMTMLVGVDVSARMIGYAREQAKAAELVGRVEFYVMDALRMIEFPANYFDLVNQRLNFSYLRTWDWPGLLQEYQRIARIGGVIRVTEPALFVETNSPALNTLYALGRDAFWHAGHLFTQGSEGIIGALPDLLHQQGIREVEHRLISTNYTASPDLLASFIADNQRIFRTTLPFLRKWTKVSDDYDKIYQQALLEMQQPDFRAETQLLTVWGKNARMRNNTPMAEHRD